MKNTQFRQTLSVTCSILALWALQACGQPSAGPATAQHSQPIFTETSDNSTQAHVFSADSAKSRSVRVNFEALNQAAQSRHVRLNAFEGTDVDVDVEDVQILSPTNTIIVGHVAGEPESAVTLVSKDGVLVGNVRRSHRDDVIEIRPSANGIHNVRIPKEEGTDTCLEVQAPSGVEEDVAQTEQNNDVMAMPVIDVLVGYTPKARIARGGTTAMQALIQMGVADTNKAFADSGVSAQVRLVGMMETKTNETTSYSADLTSLRSATDGKWDELNAERDRLGADQVTLIVAAPSGGAAGIGYVKSSKSYAFTIVASNYFGQYTFSHELGHNIGLNHSDGYVNSAGRFRTIIAYGTYPRIRRYSNPAINYNGYITGDSTHNESAILRANVSRMAGLVTPKI